MLTVLVWGQEAQFIRLPFKTEHSDWLAWFPWSWGL